MPRYADHAVTALHAVLASSQLTDWLRRVEVDEGLVVGSLTDPVAVEAAELPMDNRSPLVQVFDDDGDMVAQEEGVYAVTCLVRLSWISDTNVPAAEVWGRKYLTAITDCIRSNPLLRSPTAADAPQVIGALITGHDRGVFGDESETRHHRQVPVQVRVHSPLIGAP